MPMLRSSTIALLLVALLAGCQAQSPLAGAASRLPSRVQARTAEQPGAIEALTSRLYGAHFDQVINAVGMQAVPIALVVGGGHMSAEQARALDRDGDGALTREEYVAIAREPETLGRMRLLLKAIFAHASHGAGFIGFDQRSFEVNFGRKYDPDQPNQGPLLIPLTIPEAAFKAADRDHDGRLVEEEAPGAIGVAMLNALAGSAHLGEVIQSLQALPWAH